MNQPTPNQPKADGTDITIASLINSIKVQLSFLEVSFSQSQNERDNLQKAVKMLMSQVREKDALLQFAAQNGKKGPKGTTNQKKLQAKALQSKVQEPSQ